MPEAWRPYLLFALDGALADWLDLFPASTLRGVTIHFGDDGLPRDALAIHSPRTRTIRLRPDAGLGSLAHELGHEMDRAESERRYGSPHRYATDDAVHRGRRDAFAAASRGILMRDPVGPAAVETSEAAYLKRPAEIFARNVDWYVAAVLADRGRMNGDLSGVRDERLSGFGGADQLAPADSSAAALARTLLLMAPVPRGDLRRFVSRHTPVMSPRPAVLADSIAEAGRLLKLAPSDSASREVWLAAATREVGRVRAAAAAARAEYARCAVQDGTFPVPVPAPDARRALIGAAEQAGVRRVVAHYASLLAGGDGPAWLSAVLFAADAPRVTAVEATWLRRLADASTEAAPAAEPLPLQGCLRNP